MRGALEGSWFGKWDFAFQADVRSYEAVEEIVFASSRPDVRL